MIKDISAEALQHLDMTPAAREAGEEDRLISYDDLSSSDTPDRRGLLPCLILDFDGDDRELYDLLRSGFYLALPAHPLSSPAGLRLLKTLPRERLLLASPKGLSPEEREDLLREEIAALARTDCVDEASVISQLSDNRDDFLSVGRIREGRALIIAGGDYFALPEKEAFELIIAADRGLTYAERMGLCPDLVVGDFDSFEGDAETVMSRLKTKRLPVRKNDSDLQSALKCALSRGFRDITIISVMGGRFDHMLANLQCASYAAKKGAVVRLAGPQDEITVFSSRRLAFPKREGWSLSAFALTDSCEDVTIENASYTASHFLLTNDVSRGLSNLWLEEGPAYYSVGRGVLAVVQSKMS